MIDCLIVDDEKELANTIRDYFIMFGLSAACCYDLSEAELFNEQVAVMLLDINLPSGVTYDLPSKTMLI